MPTSLIEPETQERTTSGPVPKYGDRQMVELMASVISSDQAARMPALRVFLRNRIRASNATL